MKRTPLEVRKLGGLARGRQQASDAGIPDDAPRNQFGQRCVEKTCVVCSASFLTPPSGATKRKTCSRSCAAAYKKARSGATRMGSENPYYRHGKRVGDRNRGEEQRWYAAMAAGCAHPSCLGEGTRLALHHVVYRQEIRRVDGDRWDPRNALTLCDGCHMSHHRRGTYVVPLSVLPDSAFEFATELLGPERAFEYLKRRYAGEDARLDALLSNERQAA